MKYYFIGIKGTGMSGLACILNDLGNIVIGYDDYKEHKFTENELELRNIKIYNDSSYQLTDEIVVYSAALRAIGSYSSAVTVLSRGKSTRRRGAAGWCFRVL